MNKEHNIKLMDFESYLMEKHAEDYHGTDDDMPDAFDAWLMELHADDFIKYGNEFLTHTLNSIAKTVNTG